MTIFGALILTIVFAVLVVVWCLCRVSALADRDLERMARRRPAGTDSER